jgi:putative molybdopterin biosynthesis protein
MPLSFIRDRGAMMEVKSRLAEVRRLRGVSAAGLAARVGVTRQTIYAIEAQRYIPNTLVALRLSEALEVPVEQLFALQTPSSLPPKTASVELLLNPAASSQLNQPVRLCTVGSRKIAVPVSPMSGEIPAADAIVLETGKSGTTTVQVFAEESHENRLLIAGCDPAIPVLARHLFRQGNVEAVTVGCSSTQAMQWLKEKKVHIGGTHLRSESGQGANFPFIEQFFPKGSYHVATFASWEEGIVVANGNPKGIKNAGDFARKDVAIVNREVGAGSRFLLDSLLKKAGVAPSRVRGYRRIASGHVMASWHVQTAQADCCIATAASARIFGLDFIPLVAERFDLVIPDRYWDMASVQMLLETLNRSSLRRALEALGGYDTSQTGQLVN